MIPSAANFTPNGDGFSCGLFAWYRFAAAAAGWLLYKLVAPIFALLVFGKLFSFFGVLLALPERAASLVDWRALHAHYVDS